MRSDLIKLNNFYEMTLFLHAVFDFITRSAIISRVTENAAYFIEALKKHLALCLLEILRVFFVLCYFFFQSQFFKKKNSFRNTIRVANSLYADQARRSVEPQLGPNCLQKLLKIKSILGIL